MLAVSALGCLAWWSAEAPRGASPYEILNIARITGSSADQCGGTCSASSRPVTPSDHTSAMQSYPLSEVSTSGASQYGEPMTVRRLARVPARVGQRADEGSRRLAVGP